MKDIAYDHNDQVKVMSAAEVAAGGAHFFRSAYLMEDIERVAREIMKDTMERVEKRPSPTEPRPVKVLWHVFRETKDTPCEGAHAHNTVSIQNFTNKMTHGDRKILCRECVNYIQGRCTEAKRKKRAHIRKFFDKRQDAAFPIDLPLK